MPEEYSIPCAGLRGNPFRAKRLSMFSQLYKAAYDHGPLASSLPEDDFSRLWPRRLVAAWARRARWLCGDNLIGYTNSKAEERTFRARAANTQFHGAYFDRFRSHYEPEFTAVFDGCVSRSKGAHVLDVGANWGQFTGMAAASPWFNGMIACFEADPSSCDDLRRFVESCRIGNRIERIGCMAIAARKSHGELVYPDGWTTGLAMLREHLREEVSRHAARKKPVPVEALDDVWPAGKPVTLLKLDIEGAETAALRGATNIIVKNRPVILTEYWVPNNPDDDTIVELGGLGYQIFDVQFGIEVRSFSKVSYLSGDFGNSIRSIELLETRPGPSGGRPRRNVVAFPRERMEEILKEMVSRFADRSSQT